MCCSATLPMGMLTALAKCFYDIFMPHALVNVLQQRVLLTAGDTHGCGRPLQSRRYIESWQLTQGTCHAFLYACAQIFCRPSNSLCNHSMRAAENRKAPISCCAKSSAESSGVSRLLLIRSRATLAFQVSRSTSPVVLIWPFPMPQ